MIKYIVISMWWIDAYVILRIYNDPITILLTLFNEYNKNLILNELYVAKKE